MRPAVVQLGAGPVQRALVERLSSAGLVPVVVDRSPRPAGLAPGAIHVRAPIDAPEAIVEALARELPDLSVRSVLTSVDLGVASVPVVAEALDLPHAAPSAIAAMDRKHEAKTILERAGIAVPAGGLGDRSRPAPLPTDDREVVVKPVASSGSRGVSRVRGRAAIASAIESALAFGDRYLVEECVDGDHLDVNGFVHEGAFELVSIGRRFFTPPPICVPVHGGLDAALDRGVGDGRNPDQGTALARRVTRTMQEAVDAFGYRHGPIKADVIDAERGLVVLELAARFHGDVFSTHVAEAAGRAPAALHWLARLGLVARPDESPRQGAWLALFAEKAGVIEAIEGLEALRTAPGFQAWIERLGPGEEVGEPTDNRALVGFAIFGFDGEPDPWRAIARHRAGLRVALRA